MKKLVDKGVKKKKSAGDAIADFLIYLVCLLFIILCIYPFYYIMIYSISDPNQAATGMVLLPKAGSSFFAYLVTNQKMFGRKFVYRFVILTMYINAGLIPWYMTMRLYGLQNSFLLYVVPGIVTAYYVILIKTYMEQLPKELEESAKIDGAGIFTIFARIIFPLSKPIIATIAVYAIVGHWNSWTDNYFLVTDARLQTLQMVLYNYLNQANRFQNMSSSALDSSAAVSMITPTSIKMCITVIVVIPIMCVYPFLQRYFVKGIMMGAVKG